MLADPHSTGVDGGAETMNPPRIHGQWRLEQDSPERLALMSGGTVMARAEQSRRRHWLWWIPATRVSGRAASRNEGMVAAVAALKVEQGAKSTPANRERGQQSL